MKVAGQEPLPGYRLLSPLGRGGFGEVWRCEAPGGLHKAVKFVAPDPDRVAGSHALQQEYEAFQHIKAIRHPFLLQLERVELIGNELVMVMELADAQLQDRFTEYASRGQPGIPRGELLGYLADAAEALDVIAAKHGLQHLDVKPANLFLIGSHVKVGDYGLVARMEVAGKSVANQGLTPKYVAPEVLSGRIDPRSDQYSLALVYQELLTGKFPYSGKSAAQLLLQHAAGTPDLTPLLEADRGPVGRALAKDPNDRFPCCSEFIRALMFATPPPTAAGLVSAEAPTDFFRRNRMRRGATTAPAAPRQEDTNTVSGLPALTVPGTRTPPPVATGSPAAVTPPPQPTPLMPTTAASRPAPGPAPKPTGVQLTRVFTVTAVVGLTGESAEQIACPPDEFVYALMHAAAGWAVPQDPGAVAQLPDGTWGCRFPTDLLPAVVPLKLMALLEDGWCDEVTQPESGQVVLRIRARTGGRWIGARTSAGAVVTIRLPARSRPAALTASSAGGVFGETAPAAAGPPPVGEVTAIGELYGDPDQAFVRRADQALPRLLREVRRVLQSVDERRKARRLTFDAPVTVYPITVEGIVLPAVAGGCRDVSVGGVAYVIPNPPPTRYAYVAFGDVAEVAGRAILTRVVRTRAEDGGHFVAGRFKTET
jgi:serine/threonine protein kinase